MCFSCVIGSKVCLATAVNVGGTDHVLCRDRCNSSWAPVKRA
jgi:hypothetical protein